ncbi:TonB-dependent receptor plug domain-containing protein [Synoicihabitans lomoniglobus]|nr:TonB-dependent receptor plug domain-containing protein [Opitutaceae bacterium LMO-M01]
MLPSLCSRKFGLSLIAVGLTVFCTQRATAQAAPQATPSAVIDEEVFVLNPFNVDGTVEQGYMATSTLAGTRLRTELKDIGTSVSVLTKEFLSDIGANDAQEALAYATNFEVTGSRGNFLGASNSSFGNVDETTQFFNPSTSTRVRGLVSADNTRNYFRTTVAWDGYNVGRIDLLRGPNSILFGLGSPGGVVNATVDAAELRRTRGEVQLSVDGEGSVRANFNYNQVVRKDELAFRVAGLVDRKKFQQDPAFDDEDRIFVAGKYKPAFLNKNGISFEISTDFETGESTSNRPRNAPPVDQFSSFISPQVIRPIQLPDGSNFNGYSNGVIPGSQLFIDGQTVSYLDNISRSFPDGVVTSFDGNGGRLTYSGTGDPIWRVGRVSSYGSTLADGSIYTGNPNAARRIFGVGYLDAIPGTVGDQAQADGHPFSAYFVPVSMTDPSVFDFYNKLLDGPNKQEWNEFDQFRISVANTFLHNKLGYEVSYFKENNEIGQKTLMNFNSRIFVDVNEFTIDGQPNPNVGRAYVQESASGGNRFNTYELEGLRASAYFDHDFRENGGETWLQKFLGRHVFNGVVSRDTTLEDRRSFSRVVYGDDLLNQLGWIDPTRRFNNNNRVTVRYYISDDLRGRTSLSGANFTNLSLDALPTGGTIPLQYFNTQWTAASSVNPATAWVNPAGQRWEEAANPANYAGWETGNFTVHQALSGNQADFDLATNSASLRYNEVESRVLSWQGYLFNGAVVGTFGYREDDSVSIRRDAPSRDDQGDDVSPDVYNLANGNREEVSVTSRNHSLVLHLNRVPVLNRLPVDVSLSYNKGENFDPTAGRLDPNGNVLPAPQGSTEEYGVLISTKDNRYSLRVQKYETSVLNVSGSSIPNNFRFAQFFGRGAGSASDARTGVLRDNVPDPSTVNWDLNYVETVAAPAWLKFESDFDAAFPKFVDLWQEFGSWGPSNDEDVRFTTPSGVVTTGDTYSEGYEIEFVANPTSHLRLAINASKTTAVIDNVPGSVYNQLYNYIQDALFDGTTPTAAGSLRIRDDLNTSLSEWWLENVWADYSTVVQQNGNSNGEIAEWRANALANYNFDEGRLKGFGFGSAVRWESGASIGYPKQFDDFGFVETDLANPFKRGSNTRFDVWLRYGRKINQKIDWTIQLNVFNAFGENELLPVFANPDGTVAQYRIQEGRSWRLSNTFKF